MQSNVNPFQAWGPETNPAVPHNELPILYPLFKFQTCTDQNQVATTLIHCVIEARIPLILESYAEQSRMKEAAWTDVSDLDFSEAAGA